MAKYITIFLTRSFWGKNWMHTTYSSYFFWFDFKRISGKLKFVSWFSCLKRLFTYIHSGNNIYIALVNVWGKRFKLPQLTHESFLTLHHSCKIFFWYLPNWTSTDLWCVVLYVAYSTTHQRLVEVQFGRYQKNILQEWSMAKKLSCVSCGSLKRFPHTVKWQPYLKIAIYVLKSANGGLLCRPL